MALRRFIAPLAAVIAAAGSALAPATVNEAAAGVDHPYCAVSRGYDMTYERCSFATLELCLEEVRGLGGFCRPNSYYRGPQPARDPSGGAPPSRSQRR
ncbi:MAG: DUF3551 domain-containing protein [Rhizobiales bacterium]|nr:DUF3551 domain-containing protein [Hyphomicrobiales bacterium]